MINQKVQNPGRTPRDHLSSRARRSRELAAVTAALLAAGRRGTPRGSRKLTCFWQAVPGLRRFRDRTAIGALARDHGVSRATAYRYVDEVIEVLAAEIPELPTALERARARGGRS